MRTKEALLSVLVLAAVSLAGCEGDDAPDDDGDDTEVDPAAALLYWPFKEVRIVQGQQYSLFVQWPVPASATDAPDRPVRVGLTWQGDAGTAKGRSGFWSDFADEATFRLGNVTVTSVAPSAGPRFGLDGYNATAVLLYAFSEDGRLIAHTESPPLGLDDLGRVPFTNRENIFGIQLPIQIDYETYYLGDADTAPPGTTKPPDFFDEYKDSLYAVATGLPVGGVAAFIIPEDQWDYGSYFGDLYLTAKVVTLVQAP